MPISTKMARSSNIPAFSAIALFGYLPAIIQQNIKLLQKRAFCVLQRISLMTVVFFTTLLLPPGFLAHLFTSQLISVMAALHLCIKYCMPHLIRTAEDKDLPAIYRFICLLEEQDFDYDLFQQIYKENSNNSSWLYLVAVSAEKDVMGFISCYVQNLLHHCSKVAEIQEFFVDEKHRHAGIGNALITEMEKKLKAVNCILFEVTAQNKRAATHQFYEKQGFAFTHKKFVKKI